ncbi:MAG: hypothetical protein GFH27_549323n66 [Chloroflexi bacterium AL-W]|nr:hypothetical protein [Chloroflexi bacterium AL-N10]NOK84763.1 hypothetical protein [Chloroflexi bacterium AL-W]
MDGVALAPLTVAFHDPAFNAALGPELRASDTDRDTLHGGGPSNPQDLNRYSYARNNPVRYTDPSGHLAWVAGAAAIGAGINLAGYIATQKLSGQAISPGGIAQAAVSGAIGGALTAVGGPIAGIFAGKIGTVAATAIVSFGSSITAELVGTGVGLGVNQMMGIHDENLTFDPVKTVVGAAVDTVAIGPLAGSWDPPGMHTWRGVRNAMEGRSIRAKYQREQQHNLRHNRTVLRMNVAASTTAGVAGSGAYDIVSRHRQSTIE